MPIHTITGGGGLQLAVHEYGQPHGKPMLLIHGFSQCHLVWSKQYQSPLADEFRLVCLDNRGHGMSEKPTALLSTTPRPNAGLMMSRRLLLGSRSVSPSSRAGHMGVSSSMTILRSMDRT